MPIGPYKNFAACVAAQKKKGKSDESAKKICGFLEKRAKGEITQEECDKEINAVHASDWLNPVLAKDISTKSKNDLPDSDFAIILPGGHKDKEGKTVPRSLRKFPIHDKAHVRNALARLPQSNLTPEQKKKALKKIRAAAKKFGIKVKDDKKK